MYINNYEYHLMCYEDCPPPLPEPEPEDFGAKYKSVAEALDRVEGLVRAAGCGNGIL